jgi:hypothetical protein
VEKGPQARFRALFPRQNEQVVRCLCLRRPRTVTGIRCAACGARWFPAGAGLVRLAAGRTGQRRVRRPPIRGPVSMRMPGGPVFSRSRVAHAMSLRRRRAAPCGRRPGEALTRRPLRRAEPARARSCLCAAIEISSNRHGLPFGRTRFPVKKWFALSSTRRRLEAARVPRHDERAVFAGKPEGSVACAVFRACPRRRCCIRDWPACSVVEAGQHVLENTLRDL